MTNGPKRNPLNSAADSDKRVDPGNFHSEIGRFLRILC